jgi:hypothetical protein
MLNFLIFCMDFLINHMFKDIISWVGLQICIIKSTWNNYKIYGLLIVKTAKKFIIVRLWILKHHFWVT